MDKIKIGVIGTGKVAHLHAKALQETQQAKVVAVWNRSFERALKFAEQYNVDAYRDIEEMIIQEDIQGVIIGTTHPTHAATALSAMEAGAHVLIEKPLASSLQDCDAILNAAKKFDKKIGVISQRRLYPPVQRLHQAIKAGKLGQPVLGVVTMLGWRDEAYYNADPWRGTWQHEGGGVLVNQAPHQLDIFQWLIGDIDEVYGIHKNFNHDYIEVEDTAVAIVKFKNGAVGNILVSNSQHPALYGKVHIFGQNGAAAGVQTDGGAMFIAGMSSIEEAPFNDLWTIEGEAHLRDQWQAEDEKFFKSIEPTHYFHRLQIENFCESIRGDSDLMISGAEGRKTVELFTAIYRSERDNRPIKFPLNPEVDRDDFDGRF